MLMEGSVTEFGSRKWELGIGNSEVGIRKWELGKIQSLDIDLSGMISIYSNYSARGNAKILSNDFKTQLWIIGAGSLIFRAE